MSANAKPMWIMVTVVLIGVLVAGDISYRAQERLGELHLQQVTGELQPIAALVKEDEALIRALQTELGADKDSGILESYLANIRRDGVVKHADMKQRLDTLAENNTAIVTLIKAYSPQAKTAAFNSEADKFRNYASAWRDRWNSVMEIFMAGGNYAAAGAQFPAGFPAAVDGEVAAAIK